MPLPSIVLVVADDVSAATLVSEVAPNWRDLLQLSRRFDRGYTMPVCSQSRACLAFGKYGRTLGIKQAMGSHGGPCPPAGADTVASLLKVRGYSTGLVGKWHLGPNPVDPQAGYEYLGAPQVRGFDRWLAGTPDNPESFLQWTRVDDYAVTSEGAYPTVVQAAAARAMWAALPHPRFMVVALNDPHGPFSKPPDGVLDGYVPSSSLPVAKQNYLRKCRAFDWALGQLRTLPGIANTLVCVCPDNGTPSQVAAPEQDPDRVKTTVYEGGVRATFAFYGPPQLVTPGDADQLVHLVDAAATLVSAGGAAVPGDWDGASLLSALLGSSAPVREVAVCEAELGVGDGGLERAVVTLQHKLLAHDDGQEELYDLSVDPQELSPMDLGDTENAELLAGLRAELYAG